MRGLIFAAALAAVPASSLAAAPADIASAVAAAERTAEHKALDEVRRPAEVLRFLGLKKSDRVLDVFAGNGYYTEIMARAVGARGLALAWNPATFRTEKILRGWSEMKARSPNTGVFFTPPDSIGFPADAFDFALLHLVYHDFYWESAQYKFPRMDPQVMLARLFAAMKRGGTVGVVDHVADPGGDARTVVDKLHRIDPKLVRVDFERAGFVFEAESDVLRVAADDRSKSVFDPAIRGKTDRIVYRFRKP